MMVALVWSFWLLVVTAFGVWLARSAVTPGPTQVVFLPGPSTNGHHQIEHDCAACHAPEGGIDQNKCLSCHGAELQASQDSHPRAKFTDPRNADRLTGLDALACITCHVEHQPGITHAMGVTLPEDYCLHCHADVAKERPTHQGLPFSGCLSNGCHNYHDNRALHESFLAKHLDDPDHRVDGRSAPRDLHHHWKKQHPKPSPLIQLLLADEVKAHDPRVEDEWSHSAHARAGVGCADCHARDATGGTVPWTKHPTHTNCVRCHDQEVAGWQDGKHGMRTARGLPPMTPGQARLPMRSEVAHQTLDCSSCHSAHRYDTVTAAVESCLKCHSDQHSLAYVGSPHHQQWKQAVVSGDHARGVSCATCHMPRERTGTGDEVRTRVVHDQNAYLRPRETMVRAACLDCHGLGFALDAIADDQLVERNFTGRPAHHLDSLEWVRSQQKTTGTATPATPIAPGASP